MRQNKIRLSEKPIASAPSRKRRSCFPRLAGIALGLALTLAAGCSSPASRGKVTRLSLRLTNEFLTLSGPTIRLQSGQKEMVTDSMAEFMYFIPLISPDPVFISESPGNTQRVSIHPARREFERNSFSVRCDFEFSGAGTFRNRVDTTGPIRRNEAKLKSGGVMERQLSSISVEGIGLGSIEVEGTLTNHVSTVREIRLHFNRGGGRSPVTIGLCDIRCIEGEYCANNDLIARVNTLTFREGAPRMDVGVGSLQHEDAGDSLWQKLKGGLAGVAANLFIKPMKIDPLGHETMLQFGRALADGASEFTFPRARILTDVSKSD